MVKFLCILLCLNLSFFLSQELDDDNIVSTASNPPLLPPPENHDKGPFKPSIHMIVGALIFTFSITFLVFLYVKHCKSGSNGYPSNSRGNIDNSYTARKNSGIDPNVIDLLPVFRFSALRGQKDGLECAVCLTNYEPSEVLRLLPKCKHAFHVECVDTWLDAHSTCPLCRYRVDPEDVLLIEHNKTLVAPQQIQPQVQDQEPVQAIHRTPGRHSSAGENITKNAKGYLQITVQKPPNASTSTRHSLDSSIISNKRDVGSVSTKCFDKPPPPPPPPRKDELLLAGKESRSERRLQHRIVVSSNIEQQRWSDVQPSELLYIGSEKLISESRRVLTASEKRKSGEGEGIEWSGRKVNNERSVSEIISRKRSNEMQQQRQRQHEGFVSRWLAWASFHSNNNIINNNSPHLQPPPVLHTFNL